MHHHIDIRDRDIIDEHGRRKLTFEMMLARTHYLPEDCAIATALNGGFRPYTRLERIVGGDLFEAIVRAPNPRFEIRERASPLPIVDSDREALRKKRSHEAAARRAARIEQETN